MSGVSKLRKATPKRLRGLNGPSEQPLPVVIESLCGLRASSDVWPCYRGVFTGHSVIVSHQRDAEALHNMGCFGKPSTSKFSTPAPTILRRRQYKRRQSWAGKVTPLVTTATVRLESSDSSSDESVVVEQERPQQRASWPLQGLATRNWYHGSTAWGNTDVSNVKKDEGPPYKKAKVQTAVDDENSQQPKPTQSLSDDEVMILSDSRPSSPEIQLIPQGKENKNPNLATIEKSDGEIDGESQCESKVIQNEDVNKTSQISNGSLNDSCEEIEMSPEKPKKQDIPEIINLDQGKNSAIENTNLEKNGSSASKNQNSNVPELISLDQAVNCSTETIEGPKLSKESLSTTTKDPEVIYLEQQEINVEHSNPEKIENQLVQSAQEPQNHEVVKLDDSPILEKSSQDVEKLQQEMNPVDGNIVIDITSPGKTLGQTSQATIDISSNVIISEQSKIDVLKSKEMEGEKSNLCKGEEEKEQISTDPNPEQEKNDIQNTMEEILNSVILSNSDDKSIKSPKSEESSIENENNKKTVLKDVDKISVIDIASECASTSGTSNTNNLKDLPISLHSRFDDGDPKDTDSTSGDTDCEDLHLHWSPSESENDAVSQENEKETSNKAKEDTENIMTNKGVKETENSEVSTNKNEQQSGDVSCDMLVESTSKDTQNLTAHENSKPLNDVQLTVESILVEVEEQSCKQKNSLENVQVQKNCGNIERVNVKETDITKKDSENKSEEISTEIVIASSSEIVKETVLDSKKKEDGSLKQLVSETSQSQAQGSDSQDFSDSDTCNIPITESGDYEPPEEALEAAGNMLEFLPITESRDYEGLGVVVISDCEVEGDKEEIISKWRPMFAPSTYHRCDEALNLSLEEAFFLSWALGCLNVSAPQSLLLGLLPFETIPPSEKPPSEPKPKNVVPQNIKPFELFPPKPHLKSNTFEKVTETAHDVIMIEDGESSVTEEGRSDQRDVMVIDDKTDDKAAAIGGAERLQSADRTTGKEGKERADSPQPGPSGLQNFPPMLASAGDKTESREVPLSPPLLWSLCLRSQPGFACRYAVYHHYRSLGWVVKSGLKFGGDFLLYRQGPKYHHASYMVLVCRAGSVLAWQTIMTANRVAEVTNKEVLLCWVHWPSDDAEDSLESLSSATLSQRLVGRPKLSSSQSHRDEDIASGEESDSEDSD